MKFEIETVTETIYIESVTKLCYNKKMKKVQYHVPGMYIDPIIENVENVWRLED